VNSELTRHRQRVRRQRRARRFAVGALAIAGVLTLGVGLLASARLTPSTAPTLDIQPIRTTQPTGPQEPASEPTTAPPANTPLVRLAALGDSGTRGANQAAVAAQIAAADKQGRPFDALLITGDLVYDEGEAKLTDRSVVTPYAATFQRAEIIPSLGNHDVESDEGREIMRRLGRPAPVYVHDVGPVKVVALDSNNVNSRQTEWLGQVLATPSPATPWVIPIMHHPPFSSGDHGSSMDVRRAWSPVFARNQVKLVLAGHDHSYERTNPQNGVTYIVTGGGGADLYDVGRSGFTATSAKRHHFLDLNVFADRIEGRAIDKSGTVFDTFTIQKAGGTAPPPQAQ
jgi:3',5'-cyclic AMP phosphodiesterase CpdA